MIVTITLCFLTFVLTKAARCEEYPNCSICNLEKTACTSCDNGYFGKKCDTLCSKGCRNRTCVLTSLGIENCTEGCLLGLWGPNCKVPCTPPPEICSACPSGCEGGYCQLGSSCVSGCKDGFYGSGCKDCSSRCKTCNRINGTCDECHPSYFGFECEDGCAPGFYGIFCEKDCSKHCQAVSDMNSSTTRSPECSRETGGCVKGCVDGWYGATCSSQCSPRCLYKRCSPSGGCVDGCVPGYFGTDCMPCPDICVNNSCNTDTWSCEGCDNGFYGMFCNQSCCQGGECDKITGICSDGCNVTGYRCDSPCASNCTDTVDGTPGIIRRIQIGIPIAVVLFLLCIVIMCILRRKGCFTGTEQQTIEAAAVEYHRYWQIRDDDIDIEHQEPAGSQEVIVVMPVIADCFPAGSEIEVSDPDTSNSSATGTSDSSATGTSDSSATGTSDSSATGTSDGSATDSQSYTHLMRDPDVRVADPVTVVNYISPTDSDYSQRDDVQKVV